MRAEVPGLRPRLTFRQYPDRDYLPWARLTAMMAAFGDAMLDSLTTAEVERFLDGLLVDRSQSTRNGYRTLLHAMLNRARSDLRSLFNSKTGYTRQVPMNSLVRSLLVDLATQRQRPDQSEAPVFMSSYTAVDKFFPNAVERAQEALRKAWKETGRLDGYTWHCNRHTFASRLVIAGVDLRSVQALGGWRTLSRVQRYSHLAPAHLPGRCERLVMSPVPAGNPVRNLDETRTMLQCRASVYRKCLMRL